ncbi:sex hormone-binding globulin [Clupea harengus]|uniref:Sex hormone-binding globulin n=1 Tax=Clupea harengus TaxID=7950 RepID=A0A6P3W6H7_CLUHA|nr:sex hormone-binding globulin [Clupea harengus]
MGLTRAVLGVLLLVILCVPPGRCEVDAVMGKIEGGGLINLGNRERTWTPFMSLSTPLTEIQSITSYFSFRTFDPEGAIFYGDTRDGNDWFVLSLREGIPEMQIGKAHMKVSVVGGPKLNDGLWHKVELRSEDTFVVLEVDNKRELVVGLHTDQPDTREGLIRLALGGILIDEKKLLVPFNPLLDGCVQGGHWLNISTPWDSAPRKTAMPCFTNIKTGSFFPGTGLAIFNTSDFPGVDPEEKGIIITVNTSSKTLNGTILSMRPYESPSPILSVAEDTDSGMMALKVKTDTIAVLNFDKDFISFDVIIQKTSMSFETKVKGSHKVVIDDDFSSILAQWKKGMLLAFGGVPGDGADYAGSEYMEGCLDTIFVQGQKVDLDQALFKDASVSSHSCPV